jgi:hypothetical protein
MKFEEKMTNEDKMRDTVRKEWLTARNIIIQFLKEIQPDLTKEEYEHNAAALIARLGHHNPPILLEFCYDEV